MALTDPELDLLRELLEDDPVDEAFLQVGEELVRRGLWAEAEGILSAGLAGNADELHGWALLARASLECNHLDVSLAALARIDCAPETSPQNAQLEILALERLGRTDQAAERIEAYLQLDPDDVVVTSARERLAAPPPATTRRAADPFVTVERAEQYVAVGRPDRAVRLYRRILFHNPGDSGLLTRLRQLARGDLDFQPDDLSEELTDPGATPPDLQMPQPRLSAAAADEEPTDVRPSHELPSMTPGTAGRHRAEDPDDEDTDLHAIGPDGRIARTPAPNRRRRRSLINR